MAIIGSPVLILADKGEIDRDELVQAMAGRAELAQLTHELETAIAGPRSADAAGGGLATSAPSRPGEPGPQQGPSYG